MSVQLSAFSRQLLTFSSTQPVEFGRKRAHEAGKMTNLPPKGEQADYQADY